MRVRVAWLGRPSASPYEDTGGDLSQAGDRAGGRPKIARRGRPAADAPATPSGAIRLEAEAFERQCEPGCGWWRSMSGVPSPATVRICASGWPALEDGGTPGVVFAVGSDLGLHKAFSRPLGRAIVAECHDAAPPFGTAGVVGTALIAPPRFSEVVPITGSVYNEEWFAARVGGRTSCGRPSAA